MLKKWAYLGAIPALFMFLILCFTYEKFHVLDKKMAGMLYGNRFIEGFHFFGETKVMIVVTIVLLAWYVVRRNYRGMLFVIFSIGGGTAINQIAKRIVERPRPDLPGQLTTFSFPSAHTTIALLLLFTAVYIATEYRRNRGLTIALWSLAIVLTVLAGLSRIAEGRHFATDVLAAWSLTYAWFALCAYLYRKYKGNPESR